MKKLLFICALVFLAVNSYARDNIAVIPFESDKNDASTLSLTKFAEQEVISVLNNSGRFIVTEHYDPAAAAAAAETGDTENANVIKFIVSGKISNVSYNSVWKADLQGKARQVANAFIEFQIKITQVSNGTILLLKTYDIKNGAWFNPLSPDLGRDTLLLTLLAKNFEKTISEDILSAFSIEGTLLSIDSKKSVVIDIGSEQGVKKGMKFNVVVTEEKTNTAGKAVKMVRRIAELKASEVSEESTVCRVSGAKRPLEEGMRVVLLTD
ncbi:MAG: hypothetical protein LBR69_02825 [Endomicrobium sp.]|nr:hypothetical protein [Endomicrobium sp.]